MPGTHRLVIAAIASTTTLTAPVAVLIQVLVVLHLVRAWRRMRPREPLPSLASVFE